jgi:hypothetical protein
MNVRMVAAVVLVPTVPVTVAVMAGWLIGRPVLADLALPLVAGAVVFFAASWVVDLLLGKPAAGDDSLSVAVRLPSPLACDDTSPRVSEGGRPLFPDGSSVGLGAAVFPAGTVDPGAVAPVDLDGGGV